MASVRPVRRGPAYVEDAPVSLQRPQIFSTVATIAGIQGLPAGSYFLSGSIQGAPLARTIHMPGPV